VSFVNQGRIAEGMEAFRAALALDPSTKRRARRWSRCCGNQARRRGRRASPGGLAVNAENTGLHLLARIMVERNQVSDALFVLQRPRRAARPHADFHAFAAASTSGSAPQGSHRAYRLALRIARLPECGGWAGISFQAPSSPRRRSTAYTRAKSAGNLAPELLASSTSG